MAHLVMLVACLLAGWALRASGRVGENAHQPINALILHLALPAVTLRTLHGFVFDREHLLPALVVGALWLADAAPTAASRVSVIEAAMPPMIGAGIVAAQANLAPRLVSVMVGVGIPLGLVTACLWHWVHLAIAV